LREEWLDFFLGCALKVAPEFRIVRPKTKYVPIQTENGSRNPISVWQKSTGVRISFTLDKNSNFEARLRNANLTCDYEEGPKHLLTFTSESPEGAAAEVLKTLAIASAERALSGVRKKSKKKHGSDNLHYGGSI
jgi:hypothetical protein